MSAQTLGIIEVNQPAQPHLQGRIRAHPVTDRSVRDVGILEEAVGVIVGYIESERHIELLSSFLGTSQRTQHKRDREREARGALPGPWPTWPNRRKCIQRAGWAISMI